MKLVPLLMLALVACKSNKAAAPTAGSATVAAPAPKSAPVLAPGAAPAAPPAAPTYIAPEAPEGEVVPAQAAGSAGSAAARTVAHDAISRVYDKLDANHDGKLTPDEASKRFGGDVDLDGDGEISKKELEAAMREQRIGGRARLKR